jgi:hypothetical protein
MITLHHTGCYQQPLKTFFFEPVAQCFQTQQSPHQSQNFPTFMEYKDPLPHTQEPTMNPSLGQMNPIHIISPIQYFHTTHTNISQFNSFTQLFWLLFCVNCKTITCMCYKPGPSHIPSFKIPQNVCKK